MPPRVTIEHNSTLDKAYQDILHSIDQRFHNYQLSCPTYPTTEAEMGEIETLTAHATHAGGGRHADDLYDKNGVHLERRLG